MNIERLNQIEEIYHAALKIPLGKREAFFDKTCGADVELRREVESLLSFEKTSDNFLDNSPKSIIAEIFHEESNLIGKQINQYKILSLLGEGGMGAVYLAQDTKLLRNVALKILPADLVSEENRVQRFIHEARAASTLNHPHILTIYSIGVVENLNYIAMEFVDGVTFHDSIYRSKTDLKTLLKYLAQTAEGLAKAHSVGIVHRDLKPENIMVSSDGYAKILDFGLAKLVENEGILRQAQQHESIKGVIMGTLGYMSPEQAQGKAEIDQRSDIFSFGCILYETLARRKPFSAETTVDALYQIIHAEPAPLEALPDLQKIVERCLKKSPEDRFQTIAEVANLLKKIEIKTDEFREFDEKTLLFNSPKVTKPISKSISEQRRQATILSAEFSVFSEMLEELEPEEASELLNDLQLRLNKIVENGGGKIEKRLTDTFVALWGTSAISEEDPERATRTALNLQKEAEEFARNIQHSAFSIQHFLKIGISTGTILLGKSSDTGEFMTMGAAVNTAKRLQKNAPLGKILISRETYRHIRGVFDVEVFELEGEKAEVYSVKAAKPRAFRLGKRGVEGIETRLVGRKNELEKMLDALETVFEDGEMQAVSVIGEAGLGKSRLLFEFRDCVELMSEKVRVFNARATETMRDLPYSLVRDLFSFRFEILDDDSPEVAREKLVAGFLKLIENSEFKTSDAEMKIHFIGQLIGFDFSDSLHVKGILDDLQQLQTRALLYAGQFFSAISAEIPTVIYLDDLHWADEKSLEFFDYLARNCVDAPILILEFARPALFEHRPHWGEGQTNRTRLNLTPLTKREIRALIEDILQKMPSGVPTNLQDLIISNAEGNPFYVEELIKMLIDRRAIIAHSDEWTLDESRLGEAEVPATLNGVLQARLDKLTVWEKKILQQASVIGREFWDKAVESFGAEINVPAILESLRRKELLYRHETSVFSGANEYLFKHALLRDATYETVLLGERRKWHEKTANWLIETSGERADEYAATIAAHFEKAQNIRRTAEWFGRAGNQASKTYAAESAALYFQKALQFAEKSEISLEQKMDWQKNLGMAFWARAKFAEGIKAHREMLKIAETLDDKVAQTQALYAISAYQLEKGENRVALESAVEAVRIAREAGDSEAAKLALSSVLYRQGRATLSLGNYEKAIEIGEEGLQIAETYGEPHNKEKAFCFHLLAGANMFLGNYEKAVFYGENEVYLREKKGDKRALAQALNILGEIMRLQGDGERAAVHYDEALTISREIGNKNIEILTLSNMGGALLITEDFEKAENLLRKVTEMIGDSGHFILPETLRFLAEVLNGQNKNAEALDAARKSLKLSQAAENRENIAFAWRVLGLIAANSDEDLTINDELLNASQCFDKALQIFTETKMEAETARTLRDFARYENKRGNGAKAKVMLDEAKEIFTRLEMPLEIERCSV